MTERRRRSSKPPPPAAPTEASPDLVPRPTRGDPSAGRYSMTSDAPPALRKSNTNPPPPVAAPGGRGAPAAVDAPAEKTAEKRMPSAIPRTDTPTRPGFAAVDVPVVAAPVIHIDARVLDAIPPSSTPIIREKADVPSLPKIPAPPPVPSLEMPKVVAKQTGDAEPDFPTPTPPEARETAEKKADPAPAPAPEATEPSFDARADVDWQKLWLATQKKLWKSLVVVPAGKEVDAVSVARALASVGGVHHSREVGVIDATKVGLGDLKARLAELKSRTSKGETVLVAVKPVKDNPTSAAFAEAADVAILCVALGASNLDDASAVVEEIGRDRFLGTAVLEPKATKAK